ncbi:MAG TPA: energy transducer TonB [Thermoanaerobaculia bacterium]
MTPAISPAVATVRAPTERPAARPEWPSTASWWTRVSGEGPPRAPVHFSMRRVGESPEFRFSSPEAGRSSSALILGGGIFWWQEGRTLGLRYRSISPESVMPPAVFTEAFPSEWKGSEVGLETVSGQPAMLSRGTFRGKDWNIWLPLSLELPPLRMTSGTLVYENVEIETGAPIDAELFSPPAGIEFEGPGDDWKGPPSFFAAPETDEPMTVAGDVQAPVLIKKVEPAYPAAFRVARIAGNVILEAIIGKDGNVREARVIRSAHPLLDEEALKAVRQWVYRPATWKGKSVSVYLTVTMSFRLN